MNADLIIFCRREKNGTDLRYYQNVFDGYLDGTLNAGWSWSFSFVCHVIASPSTVKVGRQTHVLSTEYYNRWSNSLD